MPLENVIQDLFKEKEMMEREMERYQKKYREISAKKENGLVIKTSDFLNQSMYQKGFEEAGEKIYFQLTIISYRV